MNNWSPADLWQQVIERLRPEIGSDNVELWLRPVEAQACDNHLLRVKVPNSFFFDHIQRNYQRQIEGALKSLAGEEIALEYQVARDLKSVLPKNDPVETPSAQAEFSLSELNPRYTFSSFVVGTSNRFAHATAEAISKAPGKQYNPFFLYGGSGLGKTHLLFAIGNAIRKEFPRARVLYTTSEQFVNEFIDSLRYDKPDAFRSRFRSLDVLLMDDIQFMGEKGRSVEEFFHTFNVLSEARKQIVLSSDRPPKELVAFDPRMISRFEWGVVVDIKPPDLETRIAILRKKAELEQISIPNDVIVRIAEVIKTNIRELEGCLTKMGAFAALTGSHLTVDIANEVLKDSISSDIDSPIRVETIQKVVAEKYHLDLKAMKGHSRTKEVAMPRQVAMYLCCTLSGASTTEIGRAFGGKDHTTVIHARKKIQAMIEKDTFTSAAMNELIEQIRVRENS
ncbi:MAG: chromosomal replication initiator protein DnaA [Elusimicrobia bacterium]|nr:chromosomal replication initiator protein DnaA [Elusimicrobiota bacterium]